MIQSIQDQMTCDVFAGCNTKHSRRLPQSVYRKAKMLLELLNAAQDVMDMASPPGNRLHKLEGKQSGFWSVRINDQYRLIFQFNEGNAMNVAIVDYH